LRLGIVLIDLEKGQIHGPCPYCKADVVVADDADLSKAVKPPRRIIPGIRVKRT